MKSADRRTNALLRESESRCVESRAIWNGTVLREPQHPRRKAYATVRVRRARISHALMIWSTGPGLEAALLRFGAEALGETAADREGLLLV